MFALHTGASGLQAFGEGMTVIGANIANVNTVGYKSSRVTFRDLLATNIAGTNGKLGKGVRLGAVQADFSQGNLRPTTLATDLAIEGNGFFTIRDQLGRQFYTRAGNFQFDKEGFLVTTDGAFVMVRDVDAISGDTTGFAHPAKLLGLTSPPEPTGDGSNRTGVKITANLDADADIATVPFDPTNVQSDMYNFSTTVTVTDRNGGEHTMTILFRKEQDQPPQIDPATGLAVPGTGVKNRWSWYGVSDASEFGGVQGSLVATSGGFIRFSDDGRMIAATNGRFVQPAPGQIGPDGELIPPGPPILVEAGLEEGAPVPQVTLPYGEIPLVVGIDFGLGSNPDDLTDNRTGLDGITQFSSDFNVTSIEADGHKAGNLEDIEIERNGTIVGTFDNGDSQSLARIMLTKFASPENLLRRGETLYEESIASGRAIHGNPIDGGLGSVRSRNLERSNVDLAREFVAMIETQRAFQANARSISTSDEMLNDLVSMKR